MSVFLREFGRAITLLGWLFCSFVFAASPVKEVELCPHIVLRGTETVSLAQSEKLLVCGDPKNPAWDHIPDNQAIFNLRNFLQQRGYNSPRFEVTEDRITADIGQLTIVTKFITRGGDPGFNITRLRNIVGEVLTPNLLDQIKERIRRKLQANGHACPEIRMEASSETGEVAADLKTGPAQKFVRIEHDPVDGVDAKVFNRYNAFHIGDPYNEDFLTVTVHRVLDDGIVQSTFFTSRCEPDGVVAHQHFVPGPARQVSFGFGLDTERLVRFRAGWKNLRLGEMASFTNLTALADFSSQELDASLSWYVLSEPSRFFLKPALQIKHENVDLYEDVTSKLLFGPAGTFDSEDLSMVFSAGPTANATRMLRGPGPKTATFMSIGGQYEIMDHYYEYYRASPRKGFDLRVDGNFANKGWLSDVSAFLVKMRFERLWNVGGYEPPFLILGVRGVLGTTFTNENVYSSSVLPIDFRQFLGGSADMRGFALGELPGGVSGGLTGLYLGGEARLADVLPWGIQPFVFIDGAVFSARPFSTDGPIFYSPGVGIRWQSPVGVIRGSVSHGYVARDSGNLPSVISHWQPYISLGEEF